MSRSRKTLSRYRENFRRSTIVRYAATLVFMVYATCIILPSAHGADLPEQPLTPNDSTWAGEPGKTFDDYFELFKQDPGNPDINFSLGRKAFESKDYETAIMAFERVLMEHPDAARAKLELARSYFNLGSYEMAEQYFSEVLALNPPENVRANIERYRQAMKTGKREHFVSARLYLGMDFDDNVNATPTNTDIAISLGGAITVTLDDPEKDLVYTGLAMLNYLYKPQDSNISWKVNATTYHAVYQDTEGLDVNLFDIKAGPSIRQGRLTWEIYGLANHLNQDYEGYLQTFGGGAGVSIGITPAFLLSFDGKFKKKDYLDDDTRDAGNVGITASPVVVFGRSKVSLGLGWEHEDAEEDVNSYSRLNGILTYEMRLPYSAAAFATYWYQDTQYEDVYPLFGKKRSEDVQYVTAGLSKTLYMWKILNYELQTDLNLSYTYTKSDSNIDLYTYTKEVISAGVSVAF